MWMDQASTQDDSLSDMPTTGGLRRKQAFAIGGVSLAIRSNLVSSAKSETTTGNAAITIRLTASADASKLLEDPPAGSGETDKGDS
jgi:hypothetical protein